MNDIIKPAHAITEIEGVKVAGAAPGFVYYMIRFRGGLHPEGAVFPGFGDPADYGYSLGAALYTNIVEEYRLPEMGARWWALSEVKVSVPNAPVEVLVNLLTGLVLRLSVLPTGGDDHEKIDLIKAPLFSFASKEGIGLEAHNYKGGLNTFAREMLQTTPIPVAYPIRLELIAGRELDVEVVTDLLIYANVVYFYAVADKRVAAAVEPEAMAGPTGIRFPVDVVQKINKLVESGTVSSKSEFVRGAVVEALNRIGG